MTHFLKKVFAPDSSEKPTDCDRSFALQMRATLGAPPIAITANTVAGEDLQRMAGKGTHIK